MKKYLLPCLSLFLVFNTVAQTPLFKETSIPGNQSAKRSGNDSIAWYNFGESWKTLNGGFQSFPGFTSVFPDSTVKNLFLNTDFNTVEESWHNIHAVGVCFDPKESVYDFNNGPLPLKNGDYRIDSLAIRIGYFIQDISVSDTLLIQFHIGSVSDSFNNLQGQITTLEAVNDKSKYGTVKVDRTKMQADTAVMTIQYILSSSDSSFIRPDGLFIPKMLRIPVFLEVGWARISAVTLTYKPGKSYSTGDTLYFDPAITQATGKEAPKKKLNRFGILTNLEYPYHAPISSVNNSYFLFKKSRYADRPGTPKILENKYVPGRINDGSGGEVTYYPQIYFQIYSGGDDSSRVDTGGKDSIPTFVRRHHQKPMLYPNPMVNGNSLIIQGLRSPNAVVSVFDSNGKLVVRKAAAGRETRIKGLETGLYLIRIQEDRFYYTEKLLVR